MRERKCRKSFALGCKEARAVRRGGLLVREDAGVPKWTQRCDSRDPERRCFGRRDRELSVLVALRLPVCLW